jgi:hypothetical protein
MKNHTKDLKEWSENDLAELRANHNRRYIKTMNRLHRGLTLALWGMSILGVIWVICSVIKALR